MPVNHLSLAKTRLLVPAQIREHLVIAFLIDTVQAALACPLVRAVTVVTDDPAAAHAARRAGADSFSPQLPRPGLNRDLTAFARTTHRRPVAGRPARRPARPHDSRTDRRAHRMPPSPTAFARDQQGSGTTLLYSRRADALRPAFGNRSAHRHHTAGAHPLTHVGPGLRRDVDTLTDLLAARTLGRRGAAPRPRSPPTKTFSFPTCTTTGNSTTRGAQQHAQPENRLQSLRRTIRPH